MAREDSGDFLGMGTWADEDDPGAGSQTFSTGHSGTGLNANFIKVWKAITSILSAYGTLKDNIVTGAMIHSGAADGSTLEKSGSSFRVKDAGIAAAKLASDAVTTTKVLDANITAAKLASDAVTTLKIADSNVTTAKVADDAITPAKISHDNARTKVCFTFTGNDGNDFSYHGNVACSASIGIVMPRNGCVTSFTVVQTNGTTYSVTVAYSTVAANHFGAGAKLAVFEDSGNKYYQVLLNATAVTALNLTYAPAGQDVKIALVEVEFDDA